MSSFLPILQEILPMLMPGSVHITKAEELRRDPSRPHHSEDEAEPSDSGDQAADDVGDQGGVGDRADDEDDGGYGDGGDAAHGDAASTTMAWRAAAAFPGQIDQDRPSPRPPLRARKPRKTKEKEKEKGSGVTLRDAIVHKSGSLCASVLTVKPRCETVVFHNGEQEAIVYAVSGTAELGTLPDDFDDFDVDGSEAGSVRSRPEPAKHTIGAGDFAFIPAWTEHQVRNMEDGPAAADVVWVVVRNASEPTVVPLEGWGGDAL